MYVCIHWLRSLHLGHERVGLEAGWYEALIWYDTANVLPICCCWNIWPWVYNHGKTVTVARMVTFWLKSGRTLICNDIKGSCIHCRRQRPTNHVQTRSLFVLYVEKDVQSNCIMPLSLNSLRLSTRVFDDSRAFFRLKISVLKTKLQCLEDEKFCL